MTHTPPTIRPKLLRRRRLLRWGAASTILFRALLSGCKTLPPGGAPMQPRPHGSVVDEVNRMQEENAEAAKFIVYVHEFELNKPRKKIDDPWAVENAATWKALNAEVQEPRGFRLNEYCLEHVARLASVLKQGAVGNAAPEVRQQVVVERSESSKQWNTLHQYPVHMNDRLDEERRKAVVAALEAFDIEFADELVVVASAFPEGLDAEEAVQAYSRRGARETQDSAGEHPSNEFPNKDYGTVATSNGSCRVGHCFSGMHFVEFDTRTRVAQSIDGQASARIPTDQHEDESHSDHVVSIARLAERHGESKKAKQAYKVLISQGQSVQTAHKHCHCNRRTKVAPNSIAERPNEQTKERSDRIGGHGRSKAGRPTCQL